MEKQTNPMKTLESPGWKVIQKSQTQHEQVLEKHHPTYLTDVASFHTLKSDIQ